MAWDGNDRRKSGTDHDTLVTLVQIMKSHVENFDKHVEDFEQHKEDDEKGFKFLNKTVYMGMGGLATLQVIILLIRH